MECTLCGEVMYTIWRVCHSGDVAYVKGVHEECTPCGIVMHQSGDVAYVKGVYVECTPCGGVMYHMASMS